MLSKIQKVPAGISALVSVGSLVLCVASESSSVTAQLAGALAVGALAAVLWFSRGLLLTKSDSE